MEARKTRNVLGRGLSALISTPVTSIKSNTEVRLVDLGYKVENDQTNSGSTKVPIELVDGNPSQPRKHFATEEIAELSESIKSLGLLQPVLVREAKDGRYQIIAGERRWRAAKLAGLTQLPVIIHQTTDKESLEMALVENIQRQNLNPVEEAQAFKSLMSDFSHTQESLAERVGKDRATIANYLRLLSLPKEVMDLIGDGSLSMGHAKAILTIREPAAQISLARKVIKESLSVRALEAIVARVVVLDVGKRAAHVKNLDIKSERSSSPFPEIVDRLRATLGTKITIRHQKSGRGRIELEYFSEQELERLVDVICR